MKDLEQSPKTVPVFVRLPKTGNLCPHSGLSRSVMYQLCREGKIVSRVLKRSNGTRGCRLVSYQSLVQFLKTVEEGI